MIFKKGEEHINILYLHLIEHKDVQHKLEGKRMEKKGIKRICTTNRKVCGANGSKMPESYTEFSVNRHNLPPKQAEAG